MFAGFCQVVDLLLWCYRVGDDVFDFVYYQLVVLDGGLVDMYMLHFGRYEQVFSDYGVLHVEDACLSVGGCKMVITSFQR